MGAIAHSENVLGQRQGFGTHARNVSTLASSFAKAWGAGDIGAWVGLWHDVGKLHGSVQDYLDAPRGRKGPDHKRAGALLATRYLDHMALVIAGHHGGIPSPARLRSWLYDKEQLAGPELVLAKLPEVWPAALPRVRLSLPGYVKTLLDLEFFLRMTFSALVDADFLDTEAHFKARHLQWPQPAQDLKAIWQLFEPNQAAVMAKDPGKPVNRLRAEVYDSCLAAASMSPGCFRLTVPTGGGKTRSGMALALQHAIRYGMHRVIVAVPYTSIIEQTVSEYRKIFGPDAVLEYHSAISIPEVDEFFARQRSHLNAENWDAPIVVTTTVQLFESLLSNRPGKCRKLHNIARSVLILDEVQTLPLDLLAPIADVLRQLVTNYGTSVVLSSATQLALTQGPLGAIPDVRELVPGYPRLFEKYRRVRYEVPAAYEDWTWDQVAEIIRQEPQVIAEVNTRSDAEALLAVLADPSVLLLSGQLCGAHRRAVLKEIRAMLDTNRVCRLVSTQVVEAGVDLDFPTALRALGPLDRCVQLGGRCNRAGRHNYGRCIIFRPIDGHLPGGSYTTATLQAEELLRQGCWSLDDPATYERYFMALYQVIPSDRLGVMSYRESLDYPETARVFRMVEEDSTPVVVRYPPEDGIISDLLARLQVERAGDTGRVIIRQLQPYLVNIPSDRVAGYARKGVIREVIPGVWEWCGDYDRRKGLVMRSNEILP